MNYFSAEFGYSGSVVNIVSENEATKRADADLTKAIQEVEGALDRAGVEHLHAYAWPDGSLYRFIRTELDWPELHDKISAELGENLNLLSVYNKNPSDNPYKFGCPTLKDYFEKNYE